ncbi:MAG TPA: hypothetical protein VK943_03880 [Arenibaculum sp.]|nr:hypothetical protein [Arenibaculum sp.]
MGSVIELRRDDAVSALAERVAVICRAHLLQPGAVGVPFDHIAYHLGADRPTVLKAIAWLERSRRVEVRNFTMRTRPHVIVPAVCRIDDVTAKSHTLAP